MSIAGHWQSEKQTGELSHQNQPEQDMVAHAFNPQHLEARAGRSLRVPGLRDEFRDSQS